MRSWLPTFATVLLSLLVFVSSARADDTLVNPTADSLFKAGRELMDQKRFPEACAKFEESYRLDASAGTLLNLGRCNEARGMTATAWSLYRRTITLGNATNKPRHVTAAQEFMEAVDKKLARVVVTVAEPAPGLALSCGSVEIGEASRGLPLPFDPGRYEVTARAPGYEPFTTVVIATEGETQAVMIPVLVKTKRVAAAPAPKPTPMPKPEGPDPLFFIGVGGVGLGAVGLAIGSAFGVMTLDAKDEALADPGLCPDHACTPRGLEHIEEARTKSRISSGALASGGALVAAGVTFMVLRAVQRGGIDNVALVPRVSFDGGVAGAELVGSW
jgi:hypothetical protein